MLKALGGTAAEAGIYGAAQNLSLMPGFFGFALAPLLLSTLSRVARDGDDGRVARAISRDAMRVALWLLPFAGMTTGASDDIVRATYGDKYLAAAPLLSVLIFGAVAPVLNSVEMAILIAADKPKWALALSAPLPVFAICGHLLLIPGWGMMGASIVTTLVASLGAAATLFAVYRSWRISPPATTLLRSILVCAIAFALAVVWPVPSGSLLFLLKLAAISFFIPLALLFLGEFNADEIEWAHSLLRGRTGNAGQTPREV
jgi:O-antigen/teichoic acid export membrane protein